MINIDEELSNSDWLRVMRWGIVPATVTRFLQFLKVENLPHDMQKRAVLYFMTLPTAQAMPRTLYNELEERKLIGE